MYSIEDIRLMALPKGRLAFEGVTRGTRLHVANPPPRREPEIHLPLCRGSQKSPHRFIKHAFRKRVIRVRRADKSMKTKNRQTTSSIADWPFQPAATKHKIGVPCPAATEFTNRRIYWYDTVLNHILKAIHFDGHSFETV